jgi:hypothetical protein
MKVSRTAHEPASCAPFTGSYTDISMARDGNSVAEAYRDDKNTSQGSTSDDKDSTSEQDHQARFLERLESRCPKHGQRNR